MAWAGDAGIEMVMITTAARAGGVGMEMAMMAGSQAAQAEKLSERLSTCSPSRRARSAPLPTITEWLDRLSAQVAMTRSDMS